MINKYFLAKMNIPAYLKKFLYNRYGYTEIEGIPPIIFKGNGRNLLDYRIDGASGGVGDKTTNLLDESTLGVYVNPLDNRSKAGYEPFYLEAGNYNISYKGTYISGLKLTKITSQEEVSINSNPFNFSLSQREQVFIRSSAVTINDWAYQEVMLNEGTTMTNYEPYGYKVPVVISGKNLIPEIYNGWYYSETGTKISNSSIATTEFIEIKPNSKYTTTLYDSQFNAIHFLTVRYWDANKTSLLYITNSATTTSPQNAKYITARTFASDNATSGTFYFQLEEGNISTNYEPYIEPTTTNIYLDNPIEENESISLSDTKTNIPTFRGTNVLTVDTTVQPSNVYIKVGGG